VKRCYRIRTSIVQPEKERWNEEIDRFTGCRDVFPGRSRAGNRRAGANDNLAMVPATKAVKSGQKHKKIKKAKHKRAKAKARVHKRAHRR